MLIYIIISWVPTASTFQIVSLVTLQLTKRFRHRGVQIYGRRHLLGHRFPSSKANDLSTLFWLRCFVVSRHGQFDMLLSFTCLCHAGLLCGNNVRSYLVLVSILITLLHSNNCLQLLSYDLIGISKYFFGVSNSCKQFS